MDGSLFPGGFKEGRWRSVFDIILVFFRFYLY